MPRTIRIKLYKFNELSETAKKNAVVNWMKVRYTPGTIALMSNKEYCQSYNNIIDLFNSSNKEFTQDGKLA